MMYPATPARMINMIGWDKILRNFLPLNWAFLRSSGKIVNRHTTPNIVQLRQSMKLTEGWLIGLINNNAAAAIMPSTDRRSVCMVFLK